MSLILGEETIFRLGKEVTKNFFGKTLFYKNTGIRERFVEKFFCHLIAGVILCRDAT